MSSRPDLPTMLTGLISTPSVSATSPQWDMSNEGVSQQIAHYLEACGFLAKLLPIAGNPGKFNVIGALGKGSGGLVLAGHTDTVPYDEQGWQHDPFKLTEDNGRYYGLGTSDMKSFIAIAIEASKCFRPEMFKRPLIILGTADEETTMCGAEALCAADLAHARFAVIGEPTGMRPIRQHKGIIMESIALHGHSGHSSDPSLGNNAMEGMHYVMGALLDLRADLQSRYRDEAFAVPVPTLNLGHIHGGDNPNRICPHCELQIDLRPLPGMPIEEMRALVRGRATEVALARGLTPEFKALFAGIDSMQTDANSDIVQAAEHLTGHAAESVAFGTEGPFLNNLGIETIILGPGNIEQAHQPDEFLEIDRIQPTIKLLQQLIQRFCID